MTAVDSRPGGVRYFLGAQRNSVLAILEGLDDDTLRRPVIPNGWTPIGMVAHLIDAERMWFDKVVAGRTASDAGVGGFETSLPMAEVVRGYRDRWARSDAVLDHHPLNAAPCGPVPEDLRHEVHTVEDVVLHLIEETARHAGHLDMARELIDGITGLGPR